MAKTIAQKPLPTADWEDAASGVLNFSDDALGWVQLQAMRDQLGRKKFREWMGSDEFRAMVDHDLALDPTSGEDQRRQKFKLINPENLRVLIQSGAVEDVQPWHLRLMRSLNKIEKGTAKRFEALQEDKLGKKSVRALRDMSLEGLYDARLDIDLHVISDELEGFAFQRDRISDLEKQLVNGGFDEDLRDELSELKRDYESRREVWRIAFGASFERLIDVQKIQTRLRRLHNVMPGAVNHILNNHSVTDAFLVNLALDGIEGLDKVWECSPEEIQKLTDRFTLAVRSLRGDEVRLSPEERAAAHEKKMAERMAIIEARYGPKKSPDTSDHQDSFRQADAAKSGDNPSPKAQKSWAERLRDWIPGL